MHIKYSKTVVKYIDKLDKPTKQRIKKAIEGLTEEPPKGDINFYKATQMDGSD